MEVNNEKIIVRLYLFKCYAFYITVIPSYICVWDSTKYRFNVGKKPIIMLCDCMSMLRYRTGNKNDNN